MLSVNNLRLNKNIRINHQNILLNLCVLSLFCLLLSAPSQAGQDKSYLRIEQSQSSDENDLQITTIGGLVFNKDAAAHIDLSYLKSESNGNGLTFDLGGSYVFNWDISLLIGFGISLGYNGRDKDLIATYYPEAGIVLDVTNTFGLTVTTKRIYNLYGQDEDIIMLGFVFR